MATMTAI